MTDVRFSILGPVRLRRGAADLDLGARQQRVVLAMLLARPGSVVSVSELVDAIWDDDPPPSAVNVVHRCIGALRRLIEPDLPVRATGAYLIRQAAGYQLRVTEESLDLLRFRRLLVGARETDDPGRAVRHYVDALSLWQGRCAAGLEPISHTHPTFVALEAERSHAVRDAADAALPAGQARLVIPALRQAAGHNPLDEALQARLLLALAADGRQAEAFDLFRGLRRRLRDELGVSPGPELRETYDRLLHQRIATTTAPPVPDRTRADVGRAEDPAPVEPARDADRSRFAAAGAAPVLVGRDAERDSLRRLLAETAAGHGHTLLIHGPPGVGKSALLRTVAADAADRGFAVLSTAGVETERWFPFAALHLLLQPVAEHIEELPEAHRSALNGAFGGAERQPDAYRVAFAVLELLADVADRQPVLLRCDDLQWFDASSREVLSFVARRTHDHPILVVCAARSDGADWRPALTPPELRLEPLGRTAAAELLDAGAPDLPPSVRELILERSAGNPLALVELPKAVQEAHQGTAHLPLTQRLEAAFAARTDEVSPACRTFLLVMAAEPMAAPARLLAVSGGLAGSAVTGDVLHEAVGAGLVTFVEDRPEFRHPLIRSAVYGRATLTERLAVHRALAAALGDVPERQLAHLVAATLGPDEQLADRLERFADSSQAVGKVAAAVPALSRAAGLVSDVRRRTRILVRAAELSSDLNDRHQTRMLLARADMSVLGPVERARLLLVSDNAAFEPDEPHRRIRDMVSSAAGAYDHGARDVAENLLWRAAARCFFQDGDARTRAGTGGELDRWDTDPDSAHALAVRAYTEPYRHGAEVVARLGRVGPDPQDGLRPHFLGTAGMVLGDFTPATRHLKQAAAVWRSQGRLGLLARSLAGSWPRIFLGQLDQARADAEEGYLLAKETGETIALLGLTATAALVAALRGETVAAARLVAELRAADLFPHMPFATVMAQQVDGLLALFAGRAAEAYDLLARVFDPVDQHHHSVSCWLVAPDLADAAVAAGTVGAARKLLADLPELARLLPSEMMMTAQAYTSAVLAPDEEAERHYRAALVALPAGCRLARARLCLSHGRRLRGQGRRLEARDLLRTARDEFDRLGALPWAAAAREQLRASGEASDHRYANVSQRLSAQELQVATLAARGLSDREIAERLFISHRTVGSQLDHIYPRLGVTGRDQLAAALAAGDEASAPPGSAG
ncbi:ATP-binding protein [Micromonospora endophytica]|uniref:LuxR family transcriptional regulator n=1 Tax=Micromonospora endophytica TaxID=515350 RepID=A0A2W2BFB4_9ACTN|nr:BREX system ATP-binding domain-containing protein [Micromonospora endophytica]PZF85855.1 LuxR family transcriptional regulator [Micromonospora endophytica]RIW46267.1 helix-turn-helix transcriptional regulator [Micromonospora endophytica]BCJ61793.1 transcriptional regulator [Micromonospora endophytica]